MSEMAKHSKYTIRSEPNFKSLGNLPEDEKMALIETV